VNVERFPPGAHLKAGYLHGSVWRPFPWVKNIPGAFQVVTPSWKWPNEYYKHFYSTKFAAMFFRRYPLLYCKWQGKDLDASDMVDFKNKLLVIGDYDMTTSPEKTWLDWEKIKEVVDFEGLPELVHDNSGYGHIDLFLPILQGNNSIVKDGSGVVIKVNAYFNTRTRTEGWNFYMDYQTPSTYRNGGYVKTHADGAPMKPDKQLEGWAEMMGMIRYRLTYLFKKRKYIASGEFLRGTIEMEKYNRIMTRLIKAVNDQFILKFGSETCKGESHE
jgi:hypothetical protein